MGDWETELAELLDELSSAQEELLDVLLQKRDRMAAGDLVEMTELQPREEELCRRLEACRERRAGLLQSAAGQGSKADSLGDLASLAAPSNRGELRKRIKEASGRMRFVRRQSLTNWVIAQRTLLHLSQIMEIIATGGRLQPTYGKGESVTSRGALVDREA